MNDRVRLSEMLISTAQGDHIFFFCPGCKSAHMLRVARECVPDGWGYNGVPESPTFTPSVLVTYPGPDADTVDEDGHRNPSRVCHSVVTEGRIQFLNDSTHALAGQTVDLPPYPEKWL